MIVVVLSGGQDSTTCLGWARSRYQNLHAITFDYGQRHRAELESAKIIAEKAGVTQHRIVPVSSLAALGGTAMLADSDPVEGQSVGDESERGLPNTFVPGRNLVFLTLAAAWAYQLKVTELVTGVCQTDYSGYPDCRETTMQSLQGTIRAGMEHGITIHTPLMHLSKADSVRLAQEVGALDLLAHSHTCYNGQVPPCGQCPACQLRAKGFAEAGIPDPLLVRLGGTS
jgi:7-cyano-7-deazaguanine synthase